METRHINDLVWNCRGRGRRASSVDLTSSTDVLEKPSKADNEEKKDDWRARENLGGDSNSSSRIGVGSRDRVAGAIHGDSVRCVL